MSKIELNFPLSPKEIQKKALSKLDRRFKLQAEQDIRNFVPHDQCRLKKFTSADVFNLSFIPRKCFLRERKVSSKEYSWYYYLGTTLNRSYLYGINGFNSFFELAPEIFSQTLRLPDNLNLWRSNMLLDSFSTAYFNLITNGFPLDLGLLERTLKEYPQLTTHTLDVMFFGNGSRNQFPGSRVHDLNSQSI